MHEGTLGKALGRGVVTPRIGRATHDAHSNAEGACRRRFIETGVPSGPRVEMSPPRERPRSWTTQSGPASRAQPMRQAPRGGRVNPRANRLDDPRTQHDRNAREHAGPGPEPAHGVATRTFERDFPTSVDA